MNDVQIKILNFLSEAPNTYWRAHSIKRRTVEASRFKRVDAWDFGRCLRELREEDLVEKNGSRLRGWRIRESMELWRSRELLMMGPMKLRMRLRNRKNQLL